MTTTCRACGLRYDDEAWTTVCPHDLGVAGHCRRHDLFACEPCRAERLSRTATAATSPVAAARHHVPAWCAGQACGACGAPAAHKVGEELDGPHGFGQGWRPVPGPDDLVDVYEPGLPRHNLTAYLCCTHFGDVMGTVARGWCARDLTPPAAGAAPVAVPDLGDMLAELSRLTRDRGGFSITDSGDWVTVRTHATRGGGASDVTAAVWSVLERLRRGGAVRACVCGHAVDAHAPLRGGCLTCACASFAEAGVPA